MKKAIDPRRRLRLNLRKQVKIHSRFAVVHLGEGVVQLTCAKCGQISEEVAGSKSRGPGVKVHTRGSFAAKKLAVYWANGGWISGSCPKCLEAKRDELYPLFEDLRD